MKETHCNQVLRRAEPLPVVHDPGGGESRLDRRHRVLVQGDRAAASLEHLLLLIFTFHGAFQPIGLGFNRQDWMRGDAVPNWKVNRIWRRNSDQAFAGRVCMFTLSNPQVHGSPVCVQLWPIRKLDRRSNLQRRPAMFLLPGRILLLKSFPRPLLTILLSWKTDGIRKRDLKPAANDERFSADDSANDC